MDLILVGQHVEDRAGPSRHALSPQRGVSTEFTGWDANSKLPYRKWWDRFTATAI